MNREADHRDRKACAGALGVSHGIGVPELALQTPLQTWEEEDREPHANLSAELSVPALLPTTGVPACVRLLMDVMHCGKVTLISAGPPLTKLGFTLTFVWPSLDWVLLSLGGTLEGR